MLFGEYSLICNSMGLVVPYRHVSASWDRIKNTNEESYSTKSNTDLSHFLSFLETKAEYREMLDLSLMKQELESGLFFYSTIPQGYGAGSSGALVAAVYQRFRKNDTEMTTDELRSVLAGMEGFFHGSSSGIDPLSCLLGKPVLIDENSEISCVDDPLNMTNQVIKAFLIDTKLPRETTRLMQHFGKQLHHYSFFKKLRDQLIPAVNEAIQHFRNGDTAAFFQALKTISTFELNYFEPMVPAEMRDFWKQGIDSGNYLMKLCGSGGGGYMLVFTTDETSLQQITNRFEVIRLN
jgi:mevalonate kinase